MHTHKVYVMLRAGQPLILRVVVPSLDLPPAHMSNYLSVWPYYVKTCKLHGFTAQLTLN